METGERPAEGKVYATFLTRYFRALEARGVRYCLPRNFRGLPEEVAGDVDVLVRPGQLRRAEAALDRLVPGCFVLRRIVRDGHVLIWIGHDEELRRAAREGCAARLLELDLVTGLRWQGVPYLDGVAVLTAAAQERGLWVAEPRHEAAHVLCHALLDKGRLSPAYARVLHAAFEAHGEQVLEPLVRCAGAGVVGRLTAALRRGDDAELLALRGALARALLTARPGAPAARTRFLLARALRRVRALLRPPGVLIATAGPDGAGKSTLLARLREVLGSSFHPVRDQYMGWKEFALPTKRLLTWLQQRKGRARTVAPRESDALAATPATPLPWSHNLSVLHYFADLWARYLLQIRPALVRGGLVLCDRYFYDVLAQEVWIGRHPLARRLLLALAPRPTVTALLTGEAEVVAARKRELSTDQTRRHMESLDVLRGRSHTVVLDALKPLEENAEAVLRQLFPRWPSAS